MTFQEFNLPFNLTASLASQGIKKAFPIQEKVIPDMIQGEDLLGIAPTGSGKTLSYVLPILTLLNNFNENRNRHPQVLVLLPTRELAIQVFDVFSNFIEPSREQFKTIVAYGGTSKNTQMKAMNSVKVLIATPGRLLDLVESKAVNLSQLKVLVVDEADKLLAGDFKKEVDALLKGISNRTQKVLFSATLSPEVKKIQSALFQKAKVIKLKNQSEEKPKIEQRAYQVLAEKKGPFLRYLIKQQSVKPVIIFTSSVKEADKVADKLNKNGVEARAIHSKKSQHARNTAIQDFKDNKVEVLVATDLISRGIDIEGLPYVVNYELPRSPKDFIHRIGRTARSGKKGTAISLINPEEEKHFAVIQKKMGEQVELTHTDGIDLHGY